LDEKQYAENLLIHGFSYFMSLRDLSVLAKYFYYLGHNKKEIECNLIKFCQKYNSSFNTIISNWVIKKSLTICKNYKLRIPMEVNITENELNTISQLDNYKYEKILFVMLVCAKNEKLNKTKIKEKRINADKISKYKNNFYVNSKFTEILKLAKVNISKDERNKILYDLNQMGLVEATHNGSFKINFVDITNATEVPVNVLSDDNMIDAYKQWKPKETIKCSECKCTIEKKSNRHTLCDNCYKEHRKEDNRNNYKKYYYNNKNLIS
jgi:hypothetical protein